MRRLTKTLQDKLSGLTRLKNFIRADKILHDKSSLLTDLTR